MPLRLTMLLVILHLIKHEVMWSFPIVLVRFTALLILGTMETENKINLGKKLVIATRLHLGKATSPPSENKLREILANFQGVANAVVGSVPVIAVDCTPKIDGYSYVQAIREALPRESNIQIIEVTPWGKFVPALNALILFSKTIEADLIMFVSAEVKASGQTIQTLCKSITDDQHTIVAGAALPGHLYSGLSGEVQVPLNGRTCPWNTLAVWDLEKLSLTGFQCVSDLGVSGGVEECVAVALLQKLFPDAKARLVKLNEISWEQNFDDEERKKWHEFKMQSKVERPASQLQKLNLSGTVCHC